MEDLLPGIKSSLVNQIRSVIEGMADREHDNWHVGNRVINSYRKHLGTDKPMEASYDDLVRYLKDLKARRDGQDNEEGQEG